MLRLTLLALVASVVAAKSAHAQAVSDQKLWLSGTGELDLTDATQLAVGGSLRSGVDSGYDQLRGDVELSIRATEYLGFAARYYVMFRDGNPAIGTMSETRHRVAGDVRLGPDLGRLDLSYRLRLQLTTFEFDDNHFHVRNKFQAGYRVKKRVEPYVAFEFIYLVAPKAEYRETRFYVGVDWRIKKRIELGAFFMRQQEVNVGTPEHNSVLGLELTYTFRRGKKRNEVSGSDPD